MWQAFKIPLLSVQHRVKALYGLTDICQSSDYSLVYQASGDLSNQENKKKQKSILLPYYHISQWQYLVAKKVSSLPSASSRTGSPCSLLLFCINEHALLFLSLTATFQLIRLSLGSSFRRALPRDISCLFQCCCALRLKKQICCFQLDLFISQHHSTTHSHFKGRTADTELKENQGTVFLSLFPFSCTWPFYSGSTQ